MVNAVPDLDEWYDATDGLPRPRWPAVEEWFSKTVDAGDLDEAWAQFSENWLRRLQRAYGPNFTVVRSENFLLLSPNTEREGKHALKSAEDTLRKTALALGDLQAERLGKIPVLRFTDAEHYYRYIAHFDEDDFELPMSGGIFIPTGLPHVVCHSRMFEEFRPTLIHEIAHLQVRHLPLPLWVNEGLAMMLEESGWHLLSRDSMETHRAYWNEQTIQAFWGGASFAQSGELFGMSYQLAAVLFDIIRKELNPPRAAFRAFIGAAHYEDAGASAAREHLRAELAEIVEVFLGPGNWPPRLDEPENETAPENPALNE